MDPSGEPVKLCMSVSVCAAARVSPATLNVAIRTAAMRTDVSFRRAIFMNSSPRTFRHQEMRRGGEPGGGHDEGHYPRGTCAGYGCGLRLGGWFDWKNCCHGSARILTEQPRLVLEP